MITVDGRPRSDEAHQQGVQRQLLYKHEKMKIYCDCPIVPSDIRIGYWFGRKKSESGKVKISKL